MVKKSSSTTLIIALLLLMPYLAPNITGSIQNEFIILIHSLILARIGYGWLIHVGYIDN